MGICIYCLKIVTMRTMKIFNQDLTYQLYFLRIHGSEKYYSRKKIDLFFGF